MAAGYGHSKSKSIGCWNKAHEKPYSWLIMVEEDFYSQLMDLLTLKSSTLLLMKNILKITKSDKKC